MRNKTITTVRVDPQVLAEAKNKIKEENNLRYERASNKRNVTKRSLGDIFEDALLDYIHNEFLD